MNPLTKLVSPRYPSAAAAIEKGHVTVAQLDKAREGFILKRGATVAFSPDLVVPDFSAPSNISNLDELAAALSDAAISAGLGKQQKWSVALPEGSTRTIIVTLESAPSSNSELEEILLWKMERGFGAAVDLLQVSRERLTPDGQGRGRYLATAVKQSVLAEFETVFESLGWRTGLILPRSVAESRWLTLRATPGDSLLLSSYEDGFTAAIYRGAEPVVVRSIHCEENDRLDELYRFMLFYRDRVSTQRDATPGEAKLERILLSGTGISRESVSTVLAETIDTEVAPLSLQQAGLSVPSADFSFSDLAAPTGLATLAW
jgi:Tfp pilus assembly PilM family ATPase